MKFDTIDEIYSETTASDIDTSEQQESNSSIMVLKRESTHLTKTNTEGLEQAEEKEMHREPLDKDQDHANTLNKQGQETESTPSILSFVAVYLVLIPYTLGLSMIGGAASPTIIRDLYPQSISYLPWIQSSYLLTTMTLAPAYAAWSDTSISSYKLDNKSSTQLFWPYVTAILLFNSGILICSLAPTFTVFILGRLVQGSGAAGIFALSFIIIGHLSAPNTRYSSYRPFLQGCIGLVFAMSSCAGPFIAGALIDHTAATWRWCFWILLACFPFALTFSLFYLSISTISDASFSISYTTATCITAPTPITFKTLDWTGMFLLFASATLIVVPLTNAGSIWAWDSVPTITLLLLSFIFFVALGYHQYYLATHPLFPFKVLFSSLSLTLLFSCNFILAAVNQSLSVYLNLFFQNINGDKVLVSALDMFPLYVGSLFSSLLSGLFISRHRQRYKRVFMTASALLSLSLLMLSFFQPVATGYYNLEYNQSSGTIIPANFWFGSSRIYQESCLFLTGLAMGSMMQNRISYLQDAVPPHASLAQVTASVRTHLF